MDCEILVQLEYIGQESTCWVNSSGYPELAIEYIYPIGQALVWGMIIGLSVGVILLFTKSRLRV